MAPSSCVTHIVLAKPTLKTRALYPKLVTDSLISKPTEKLNFDGISFKINAFTYFLSYDVM